MVASNAILAVELAVAGAMVVGTAIFHGAGLLLLARGLRRLDLRSRRIGLNPQSWTGAWAATYLMLGILLLTIVEVWLYAGLYLGIGAIGNLRDALYHSTISFAAIGYSDAAILPDWKLVGAIEGINGNLLLGWSVAFLVSEMTRFTRDRIDT